MPLNRRLIELPWDGQPQEAVQQSGRLLAAAYGGFYGAGGALWVPQGSPSVVPAPDGLAMRFTSASSEAIRTSIAGVTSNDVTVFAVARKRTTAMTNQAIVALSAASGNNRTLLYWAGDGASNLRLSLFVGSGATFRQAQGPTLTSWTDTDSYYVVVGVVSNNQNGLACYYTKNGVETGSTITTSNSVTAAAPVSLSVGGYYNDGAYVSGFYSDLDILAAGVLPWAVSAAERKLLSSSLSAWAEYLSPCCAWAPVAAAEPRTRRTVRAPWLTHHYEAQTTLSQRWLDRGLQAVWLPGGGLTRRGSQAYASSRQGVGGISRAELASGGISSGNNTLIAAVNLNGAGTTGLIVGRIYHDTVNNRGLALRAESAQLRLNLGYGTDSLDVWSNASAVATGRATYAATHVSGQAAQLYKDGVPISTTELLGASRVVSVYDGTIDVAESSHTSGDTLGAQTLDGVVEVAAHFDQALTAAEIAELSADPMSLFDIAPISQRIPAASTTWTTTTSLSAVIQVARSLTANLGGAVQAGQSLTATAGAAIVAAQSAQSALEAAVQQARAAVATLDAAVQAGAAQSASLAAALQLARSATSALDLAVQAQGSQTASLSAQVQAAQQVSTSLSAQVQAGSSVSVAIAASVLRQAAAAVGIDLAVQAPGAQTATLSAALQVARTAATALESAVQIARTASAGVSAQVQLGSAQSAALDVAVLRAFVAAAGVQAAVAVAGQANLSLGAAVALQRSVVAAIEPVIMHRLALGAGVSAYVYDGSAPTFYPPLARRTLAIRAELRTLSIRAEQRTLKIR